MNHILAQLTNPVLPDKLGGKAVDPLKTEIGTKTISSLTMSLVGGIFIFSFIFAFLYLIIGGVSWITSGGDKAQLESARNKITHAILGLIIVAAAWAIFKLVGQFIGIDIEAIPIPTIK